MIAICKDCQEPKDSHRVIVIRTAIEIAMGTPPVEEVMLCEDCAVSRLGQPRRTE